MAKISEAAKRIKLLRESLEQNQEQFAELLGLGQTAVSALERGEYEPSGETFARLGNMAAKLHSIEDALWFWKRAGVDQRAMLLVAGKVLKAETSEMVAGLLRSTPTKTRWLTVDEKSAGLAFAPGDVVVLDETDNDAPDLRPFWNQMVLVDFGRRADRKEGTGLYDYPDGLAFGRLRLRERSHYGHGLGWRAFLDPASPGIGDRGELDIGGWDHIMYELDAEAAKEQARAKVRLYPVFRILGRAVAWFSGAKQEEK